MTTDLDFRINTIVTNVHDLADSLSETDHNAFLTTWSFRVMTYEALSAQLREENGQCT